MSWWSNVFRNAFSLPLSDILTRRSEHPLAQLYCHSIMEHHHFDQCLMILNSPVSMSFSVVSFKRELYTCSRIFRFWTYSRHHKFLNILYSFLGKEGIAQTFYSFTSLDGKKRSNVAHEGNSITDLYLIQTGKQTGILGLLLNFFNRWRVAYRSVSVSSFLLAMPGLNPRPCAC